MTVASLSGLVAITASCSSNDDEGAGETGDGGGDALADASGDGADPEVVVDAGAKDAALVDAAPLPIECAAPPCAVALTTTLPSDSSTREEGYCALLDDGTVACWGANTAGQLGNGEIRGDDSRVALRVPGLTGITSIDHTCAVDRDGAVWCWGKGPFLKSDAWANTVEPSPVLVSLPGPADKVALSSMVGCASLRDKSVVCWGSNDGLQVSNQIPITTMSAAPQAVALAAGAKELAVGAATFAVFDDGKLLSWGRAPAVGRHTSLPADGWPTRVALERVTMVDTIDGEACAVANGVGWCWGDADRSASLPNSPNPDPYARVLPASVDIPEPIARIATSKSWTVQEHGVSYYEKHRGCATTVSGAVYCWGLNNAGQAGDGSKEFAHDAVRVAGLPAPAAEVKIMPYSTCAILTNGKVYCWGNNAFGQLGAGLPKGTVSIPSEVKLP